MADLDDVDPANISIPSDDEAAEISSADPDAQAEADEDETSNVSSDPLADDDPNKNW